MEHDSENGDCNVENVFSHDIGFDANLRLKRRPDNKSGTFLGVLIVAILLFKRYYRDFRCGSYAHGQAYSAEAGVDVESVAGIVVVQASPLGIPPFGRRESCHFYLHGVGVSRERERYVHVLASGYAVGPVCRIVRHKNLWRKVGKSRTCFAQVAMGAEWRIAYVFDSD